MFLPLLAQFGGCDATPPGGEFVLPDEPGWTNTATPGSVPPVHDPTETLTSYTPGGPVPSIVEPIESVPVYGGTLAPVEGVGFVASDPPGNRLLVMRLGPVVSTFDLGVNARPFRILVEGTIAHVTLRGTGELVAVDVAAEPPTLLWRSEVCAEPRGVARSPAGPLVVACAEGQLVEVADDGAIVRSAPAVEDLRDVLPVGELLYVSRFSSAEIVGIAPDTLTEVFRVKVGSVANVAWRMRPDAQRGGVLVLHQTRADVPVPTVLPAAYDSEFPTACTDLLESTLTHVPEKLPPVDDGIAPVPVTGASLAGVVMATDFDVAAGGKVAVAAAGAKSEFAQPDVATYGSIGPLRVAGECKNGLDFSFINSTTRMSAVAFDANGALMAQGVSPTRLVAIDGLNFQIIHEDLPGLTDEAHAMFHQGPSAPLACASCHPEGGDDGVVWQFDVSEDGGLPFQLARRTMSLAGDLSSRAPFHWSGDLVDADALMADTFSQRMNGSDLTPEATVDLFAWMDGLRPVRTRWADVRPIQDAGRAAFNKAGCGSCHSGAAYTNNVIESVRAGVEPVKTPSLLGLATRQPLFHDGCAATLEERFQPPCDDGTDQHGEMSALDPTELEALITYLRTL